MGGKLSRFRFREEPMPTRNKFKVFRKQRQSEYGWSRVGRGRAAENEAQEWALPCEPQKERDTILTAMRHHWRALRYVFQGRKSEVCSGLHHNLTEGSILPA